MLDIKWHPQMPAEMREAIEPIVNQYYWLIPQWVYQFTISFYSTGNDASGKATNALAQIFVNDEYRSATLEVFADWLDGDEKTRRYNIVHELVHLYSCLPGNFFNRLMDSLYAENDRGPVYSMAKEEHSRLVEQATQDMAWAIINREDLING
jgi:hypothetical protein